jgi:L-gulonolactone oxidase
MANGDIKVFNNKSEEFQAILCSLGCLGILLKITIQCESAFKLEQIETSAKLEDVIFKV